MKPSADRHEVASSSPEGVLTVAEPSSRSAKTRSTAHCRALRHAGDADTGATGEAGSPARPTPAPPCRKRPARHRRRGRRSASSAGWRGFAGGGVAHRALPQPAAAAPCGRLASLLAAGEAMRARAWLAMMSRQSTAEKIADCRGIGHAAQHRLRPRQAPGPGMGPEHGVGDALARLQGQRQIARPVPAQPQAGTGNEREGQVDGDRQGDTDAQHEAAAGNGVDAAARREPGDEAKAGHGEAAGQSDPAHRCQRGAARLPSISASSGWAATRARSRM